MHPWNITAEELATHTAGMPDSERSEILWAYNYSASKDLTLPAFAAAADISEVTLRKISRGTYTDPRNQDRQLPMPAGMADSIRSLRKVSAPAKSIGVSFVATKTADKIFFNCNLARESRTPVFLMGASQIGKTTALSKYRDANPFNTYMVTVRAGMAAKSLAVAICEECGLASSGSLAALTSRICRFLTPEKLLIIDDFHVLTLSSSERTFLAGMEFLRAVYGANKCGMLFSTTDLDYTRILKHHRNALHQLLRRGIHHPHLGLQPLQQDVRTIVEAHGLRWPAKGLLVDGQRPWTVLADLSSTGGLTGITERLRYALKIAGRYAVPVTWEHFLQADSAVHGNTSAPPNDWT